MSDDLRSILTCSQDTSSSISGNTPPDSSMGLHNSNSSDHPRVTFSSFSWENVFSFYR